MRVEMHQRNRSDVMVDRAQQRHRDGVIAAEADNPANFSQEIGSGHLNLTDRFLDVIRVASDITRIGYLLLDKRLSVVGRVIVGAKMTGSLANRLRTEPCARPVAGAGIKRDTENRDIATGYVAKLRKPGKCRRAGVARHDGAADRLNRNVVVSHVEPW